MKRKSVCSLAVVVLALAFGCASPDHIKNNEGRIKGGDPSKITLGMTKMEVMGALGRPQTVSAEDGINETLTYIIELPWWHFKPFKVQLTNDKVVSFGAVEGEK